MYARHWQSAQKPPVLVMTGTFHTCLQHRHLRGGPKKCHDFQWILLGVIEDMTLETWYATENCHRNWMICILPAVLEYKSWSTPFINNGLFACCNFSFGACAWYGHLHNVDTFARRTEKLTTTNLKSLPSPFPCAVWRWTGAPPGFLAKYGKLRTSSSSSTPSQKFRQLICDLRRVNSLSMPSFITPCQNRFGSNCSACWAIGKRGNCSRICFDTTWSEKNDENEGTLLTLDLNLLDFRLLDGEGLPVHNLPY